MKTAQAKKMKRLTDHSIPAFAFQSWDKKLPEDTQWECLNQEGNKNQVGIDLMQVYPC
jgi:hypothetical protein